MGLALIALLAATHVLARRLTFLEAVPRSRWLSLAGGASVAYVCVHLLPELGRGPGVAAFWWLLAGLTAFYILERHAAAAQTREPQPNGSELFWISVAAFAGYNALVGYTVNHEPARPLYAMAMALHFVVNDHGLRHRYPHRYDRAGRWLLAAAVVMGGAASVVLTVPEDVFTAMLGFLGGSVVLNVFKEELPDDRDSRPLPFLAGVASFAALFRWV